MPIKQEEALRRVADKKGLKGKERDRFIYGTMINQGWRPGVDKSAKHKFSSMASRVIRLHQINQKLDIYFRDPDDDDEKKNSHAGGYALGGLTAGAAGYGGYKLNQAIRSRQGGMNALRPPWRSPVGYADAASNMASQTLDKGAKLAGQGAAAVKNAVASGLKTAGTKAVDTSKNAWQSILRKLGVRAATALSSRHGKLIELNAKLAKKV